MKFSVIIPSRNRVEDVKRAVASVCSQGYPEIEIIVVNDGSNDNCTAQYQNLPKQIDTRIRLIHLEQTREGHGASFSRNMGVYHATGDYILFLDDDDFWIDNTYLQSLKDVITHYDKKIDAVFSHQQAANENGEINSKLWLFSYCTYAKKQKFAFDRFGFFEVDIKDLLKFNGFAHLNTTVVSKQMFEKINGFDNSVMYENDRDFFLRLIDNAEKIICSDKIVAQHNIPDPLKQSNVSTKPTLLRKMQFREYFLNKMILFGKKEDVKKSAKKDKVYTLKQIASILYDNGQYELSCHYANEVFFIGFNFKWTVFTIWLHILKYKSRFIQQR